MYSGNQLFPKELWSNGPAPGQFYNFSGGAQAQLPKELTAPGKYGTQHSSQPITTGTTVLGIRFDSGVMIAADTLVSYGSLARYQKVDRVFAINDRTVIGAGGDFADFQSLKRTIDQKMIDDKCYNDTIIMRPGSLYNWLTRVLYARRSRFQPLWIDIVVGGVGDNGVPFLGHVDLRGRSYEDTVVATGLGKHLALPIVRELIGDGKTPLTQQQASEVLRRTMEVLYYRDCRTIPQYKVAVCTATGSTVEGPFNVEQNWKVAEMVKGF